MPDFKAEIAAMGEKVQSALGAKLRELRTAAGMRQGDAAAAIGVSRRREGQLEAGEGWGLLHVLATADAFSIDPLDLLRAGLGDTPAVRGGLDLSDSEAALVFTLRSQGALAAMQLLLGQMQQSVHSP